MQVRFLSFFKTSVVEIDEFYWLLLQVGGLGHIVEIDETSLKKKSKYNRGVHHKDCWLFGGVDRTSGRWFGVFFLRSS
jgi:hypothetical protein